MMTAPAWSAEPDCEEQTPSQVATLSPSAVRQEEEARPPVKLAQVSPMVKAQALQPQEAQPRRAAQGLRPEALHYQQPAIEAARRSLVVESTATDRGPGQTGHRNTGAVSRSAAGSRHR